MTATKSKVLSRDEMKHGHGLESWPPVYNIKYTLITLP